MERRINNLEMMRQLIVVLAPEAYKTLTRETVGEFAFRVNNLAFEIVYQYEQNVEKKGGN
jgi:hypothetical protein